jgi:MinD-like ATPase involved in chromosome partitioning or flagellar assembly
MDEEKINKTIEILLQNQAQFYANLQMMQETNKDAEKRVSVLESATVNLYNATTKTNETIDKLAGNVDELVDAQKETDERLNAVIFMAEKFLGNQNGKSE